MATDQALAFVPRSFLFSYFFYGVFVFIASRQAHLTAHPQALVA
jgi:hypothetical protein